MSSPTFQPEQLPSTDEAEVRALYQHLLESWNKRSADAMAEPFGEEGELIGFDGSQCAGRSEIVSHLQPIFANHPTPAFVAKVNTPAQFHGRPELVRQMTEELQQLLS